MKKRRVYVVGPQYGYASWTQSAIVNNMEESDFVLFTGGADVDPSVYGEPMGSRTSSNIERDIFEERKFKQALELEKPMLGICRGAQFLCVMAGGRLVQHQNDIGFIHAMHTWDGQKIKVTSTHHQAMYPWNLPKGSFKVLGWGKGCSKTHLDGNDEEMDLPGNMEMETVYFPKIRALGIQSHPEMMFTNLPEDKLTISYFRDLLDKTISGDLEKIVK